MKQRLVLPEVLISLHRVPGLDGIEQSNGDLRLGGLLTHRAAERAPLLNTHMPVLADTYRHVATVRIRNMATVAGSLAHADPNQDPPVTLLALDARVRIASAHGERDVALEGFFTDYYETVLEPEELLTEVRVPLPQPHTGSTYLKFLPRSADDYATVGIAASVRINPSSGACEDCRIAMGCVGVTPLRARQAEELLRGQSRSDALLKTMRHGRFEHTVTKRAEIWPLGKAPKRRPTLLVRGSRATRLESSLRERGRCRRDDSTVLAGDL
jgi:carbon-monoxide dehydrogenase medium subunit